MPRGGSSASAADERRAPLRLLAVTPAAHRPFMAAAVLALVAALGAGLARLGVAMPAPVAALAGQHGALMVSAFLGTLISLERAAALGRGGCYLGPALTALGGLLLLAGRWLPGAVLVTTGSALLVAVSVWVLTRERGWHVATMAAGAASWLVGNLLWLAGRPLHHAALWWALFLVLTIAGERLELGRVLSPPPAVRRAFVGACALLVGGAAAFSLGAGWGARVSGAGALALAAWLARHDVARRTLRVAGLPRFMAVAMLAGQAWLALAGMTLAAHGLPPAGPLYDAALHALFVGFVFSMIFAHALVILPAVAGVTLSFHPLLYLPLALLHAGLVARVAGDLAWPALRPWGGVLNALAIVLFFATVAGAGLAHRRRAAAG